MFLLEAAIGWFAQSTALLADSLDMMADAAVFAIALVAVGRTARFKAHAAFSTGVFQLVLGFAVAVDVLRRFLYGSEPKSSFMIGTGLLALCANLLCMALLQKHRSGEVHIRASWIFTKNDALANLGTVIGGVLVSLTKSALPDLVLGLIICAVVVRAGIEISATPTRASRTKPSPKKVRQETGILDPTGSPRKYPYSFAHPPLTQTF